MNDEDLNHNIDDESNESYESSGELGPSELHNQQLLSDPKARKCSILDPNFLHSYFGNSRLHYLSTWKAKLKLRFQKDAIQKAETHKTFVKRKLDFQWIMHIDFDAFFASVALLSRPELKDKCVAVAHSNSNSAEIASCNYNAREFGVCNGMSVGHAKSICSDLQVVPYCFDKFEQAAEDFYSILSSINAYALRAVSIDEAILDVSNLICSSDSERAFDLARSLQNRILEKTSLHVSIGIGSNILLARIALKLAKPFGIYHISDSKCEETLSPLDIQDLPGFGYKQAQKLQETLKIVKVCEAREVSMEKLQSILGAKTGQKLYDFCRGHCNERVDDVPDRKIVSVEVNWGVRFINLSQVKTFLRSLCDELERRMLDKGYEGTKFTLKVLKRKKDAPYTTWKFMGHGEVDVISKSSSFSRFVNSASDTYPTVLALFSSIECTPGDIRGLAVNISKLRSMLASHYKPKNTLDFNQITAAPIGPTTFQKKLVFPQNKVQARIEDAHGLNEAHDKLQDTIKETFSVKDSLDTSPIMKPTVVEIPQHIRKEAKPIYKNTLRKPPNVVQNSLTQGFVQRKITYVAGFKNLNPSQQDKVDMEVLQELPSEIQKEVFKDLEYVQKRKAEAELGSSKGTQKKARELKEIEIAQWAKTPTFYGQKLLRDLLRMLEAWYQDSKDSGPHIDDVNEFKEYLQTSLCTEKNFDKIDSIVRWFLVKSSWSKRQEWRDVASEILLTISDGCLSQGLDTICFGWTN